MASKYKHVSTGAGFSVKNGATEKEIIPQDGRTLTPQGGVVYPIIAPSTTVKANAATAAIATADFPKNNTNTGASGAIVLTLPAASAVAGKTMRVYATVAQTITLTPASGEKVYLAGSGVASKYLLIAGVIGNYCDVYSDGTDYHVTTYSGVVTKEA